MAANPRSIHERAHQVCADHNAREPNMPNVPIQTVYEWLVQVQEQAVKAQQLADAHEWNRRLTGGLSSLLDPKALIEMHDRMRAHGEIPELYNAAREACHKVGLPWTNPLTGEAVYPPPKEGGPPSDAKT